MERESLSDINFIPPHSLTHSPTIPTSFSSNSVVKLLSTSIANGLFFLSFLFLNFYLSSSCMGIVCAFLSNVIILLI